MILDGDECWRRLARSRHGVLATRHPRRGVDAVPVVFAVTDGRIVVPVDTVKPKRTTDLARLRNLRTDGRCVLLVDEYDDDDWSRLWWVRVHADATVDDGDAGRLVAALAERYPQYRRPGSITASVVLTPTAVTGWAAS